MATAFKITKNGIEGNLTGSVQGTASYAVTASYALNGGSGGGDPAWIKADARGGAILSGSNSTAGILAVAIGSGSVASGTGSHAEGFVTRASGRYSHAEGSYTIASGNYSHAEGSYTTASGNYSHAEGQRAVASGSYSHAEGYGTVAPNAYEHAQGRYNTSASSQIFSVGCGNNASNRKNAISVVTGSGAVPSASVFIYGLNGFDGTNPQPGVNDLVTYLQGLEALIYQQM